jgi:hypothetical protein
MTDAQLYFAMGLPTFAVLVTLTAGILQHHSMSARFTSLESTFNARFTSLESGIGARFTSVENRLASIEARFETLTGKVIEIDNRLTRLEAILDRH